MRIGFENIANASQQQELPVDALELQKLKTKLLNCTDVSSMRKTVEGQVSEGILNLIDSDREVQERSIMLLKESLQDDSTSGYAIAGLVNDEHLCNPHLNLLDADPDITQLALHWLRKDKYPGTSISVAKSRLFQNKQDVLLSDLELRKKWLGFLTEALLNRGNNWSSLERNVTEIIESPFLKEQTEDIRSTLMDFAKLRLSEGETVIFSYFEYDFFKRYIESPESYPELVPAALEGIKRQLEKNYHDAAIKIAESSILEKHQDLIDSDPEITQKALEILKRLISSVYVEGANKILESPLLKNHKELVLNDREVQDVALQALKKPIKNNYNLAGATEIIKSVFLQARQEDVPVAMIDTLQDLLDSYAKMSFIYEVAESDSLKDHQDLIANNEKIQQLALEKMKSFFKGAQFKDAEDIVKSVFLRNVQGEIPKILIDSVKENILNRNDASFERALNGADHFLLKDYQDRISEDVDIQKRALEYVKDKFYGFADRNKMDQAVTVTKSIFLKEHPELLQDSELIECVARELKDFLERNWDEDAIYLVESVFFSKQQEFVRDMMANRIKMQLDGGYRNISSILKELERPFFKDKAEELSVFESPEILSQAMGIAEEIFSEQYLSQNDIDTANKIIGIIFKNNTKDMANVFQNRILEKLTSGKVFEARRLQNHFPGFDDAISYTQEALQQIEDVFAQSLKKGQIEIVQEYVNFLGDEYKSFVNLKSFSFMCLEQTGAISCENLTTIIELFLQDEIGKSKLNEMVVGIVFKNLSSKNFSEAKKISELFLQNYSLEEDIETIIQSGMLGCAYNFSRDDFVAMFGEVLPKDTEEENLTYIENIQNYFSNQHKENVQELDGEEKYQRTFENLSGLKNTVWDIEGENHEIAKAFNEGARIFGYEKMFDFIGTYDRHDALYAFSKVLILYTKSELEPSQFCGQILHQVKKDKSVINDRDAYQKLNNIAERLQNINLHEVLNQASEYESIASMRALLDQVGSVKNVFTNWKTLKKFDEIVDLLKKKELLEQLKNLSSEDQRLKHYIETLIFHPNINTSAVTEFWRNPAAALNVDDVHSERTHKLKKPSNYTDIPYLQLDAFDLRDALVNGDLDKIQTFKPMEVTFLVPVDTEYKNVPVFDLAKKALGSFREKIQGAAQNPKKLFSEIQKVLKENNINLQEFLSEQSEVDDTVKNQIQSLLLHSESGLKLKMKEYRVKISEKSDPDAVVVGNDTACCMPFGSGKNNVYTYNPNCGQFLVQEKTIDGKWKTVAQSVLTKNVDIKKLIPEIVDVASLGHQSMSDLVSDDILKKQQAVIVCDNIEVAPNAGSSRDDLELIYREFFRHYVKADNSDTLNQNEFLVGLGYNDLVFGESVDNTFLPMAPVGYSDNIGAETKKVSLNKGNQNIILQSINWPHSELATATRELPRGIKDLTFSDTLKVSYIEGKAYADNQSLMEYMHNMENGLIAKDIYNAKNSKPNMSFKYENDEGIMQGYMFAYEGAINDEEVIYIADLAALPNAKLAGGRLIGAFLEEYRKNYLEKDDLKPIHAQARDKTSYRIMEKQLKNLGEKVGVIFEMEEIGDHQSGEDIMHEVIIRIKKP